MEEATDIIETAPEPPKPLPIGGWLILPAIALVLLPLSAVYNLWMLSYLIRSGFGTWQEWMVSPLLADALAVFGAGYVAACFFRKRRTTRIAAPVFLCSLALVRFFVAAELARDLQVNPDYTEAIKGLIAAAIWTPYFLLSKRVRETFVL